MEEIELLNTEFLIQRAASALLSGEGDSIIREYFAAAKLSPQEFHRRVVEVARFRTRSIDDDGLETMSETRELDNALRKILAVFE